MQQHQFHSSLGIPFSPDQIIENIIRFMQVDDKRKYKIIIGSDSEKISDTSADFVTAIVCHRVGNGGIYFWRRIQAGNCHTLRDRIWQEALNSIMLAQEMRTHLQKVLGEDFFWEGNEIHVDVGRNGPTRDLIDSVTGMIKGYGFAPVIKPYSFGASIVADRHT